MMPQEQILQEVTNIQLALSQLAQCIQSHHFYEFCGVLFDKAFLSIHFTPLGLRTNLPFSSLQ